MNVISLKNLRFAYDGDKKVIDDISLDFKMGEYVTIVGHNGSGKSTLAKLIIGLLKRNDGEIFINGNKANSKNIQELRHDIALVFQNPDNQFIGCTVEDDIAFGLENRCVPHSEMQKIIEMYAKEVGMENYLTTQPNNLSGGQKQRIAIAGALALKPKILILDEATSMLDPKGKKDINDLIKKTKQSNKDLTIISITHDIEEAYLSDRVIVLSFGKIAADGNPKEVFKNFKLLNELKLSLPFELEFKEKLKQNHLPFNDNDDLEDIITKLCQ